MVKLVKSITFSFSLLRRREAMEVLAIAIDEFLNFSPFDDP